MGLLIKLVPNDKLVLNFPLIVAIFCLKNSVNNYQTPKYSKTPNILMMHREIQKFRTPSKCTVLPDGQ